MGLFSLSESLLLTIKGGGAWVGMGGRALGVLITFTSLMFFAIRLERLGVTIPE